MSVWVLVIEHKHGTNISVHRSYAGASKALLGYVDEFWDDWYAPEEPAENTEMRIARYFENNDEFYTIDQAVLED